MGTPRRLHSFHPPATPEYCKMAAVIVSSIAAKAVQAPKVQLRGGAKSFAARKPAFVCKAAFSVSAAATEDTLTKVRTIISEQLGTDLDAVAADAKFVDLGADSLDTVEIMMALEEQFEITLDEEGAEKIATVQEAADMIQDQMA